MKKITTILFLLFAFAFNNVKAQTPDRWDTLYNQTNIAPVDFFEQTNSVPNNGLLYLYGDSVNVVNYTTRNSYIAAFNPTTSALTPLNYTRTVEDHGLSSHATIKTSTPNLAYTFFGTRGNSSIQTNNVTLYKLNSQTQSVTSEQITYSTSNNHNGIGGLCFFSPLSNHDSLLIFDDSLYQGTILRKKHFNQTGFSNFYLQLPITDVSCTFVFNNVLYVSAYDQNNFQSTVLTSTDGVNFVTNTNYTTNVGTYKMTAVDTLQNEMYFSIDDGDGSYAIYKTPDGVNFTQLVPFSFGTVTSIKKYKNHIWYSAKSSNYRPSVRYLVPASSSTLNVSSVEDIGKAQSSPNTFKLNILNAQLVYTGSYEDYAGPEFGSFIYQFMPPVANFTLNNGNTQLCQGLPYVVTNNSVNADSVRWIEDNNFYTGTSNSHTFSFSSVGSHTAGLIAIAGSQKDTMRVVVNVYLASLSITGPATACQITPFQLHSTVGNMQGSVTYTWNQTPSFTTQVNGANPLISAANAGALNYSAVATDTNGCQATSNTITVQVYASKNISGVATTSATPVQGDVVLYKYVPYLTKFDSVTYQTLNAIGEYTFNTIDSGTYLVKCLPTATNNLQVTYCLSSISWQSAQVLTHGCINTSTQNINVIPFTNLGTGAGELSGTITEGQGYGQRTNNITTPGAPIKGVIVKGGRNPGGDISSQSRTNSAGQYTLANMPLNNPGESYFILVDIPGLDTNTTYHRVITATNLQYNNLDFVVDSAKVNPVSSFVGIQEMKIENSNVRLYPNPANNNVTLEFELIKPAQVRVEMVDMLGKKVRTLLPASYQNEKEVKITSGLKGIVPGVYFIKISVDDAERTTKLIITD